MLMKKFLSVLIAVTVVTLSCLLPVSASTLTPEAASGSMQITAERTEEIEVSYPADIFIPYGTEGDFSIGSIGASKMVIALDKKVTISVTSKNGNALLSDGGKIPYKLGGAEAIEFTEVNDADVFPLTVAVTQADWEAAPAGDFSDTLTFTLAYVNQ